MLILTIRTDKPESEMGLYNDNEAIDYVSWPAHRQLAETIHLKIKDLLNGSEKDWSDIQGIVAYEGPGSFTGLRIGLSVANALSAGLDVPAVGSTGESWQADGIKALIEGSGGRQILPAYGAEAHITQPKK